MKTVKTTLIVIATLVAVYLLFDFVTGVSSHYESSSRESAAMEAGLDLDDKIEELASKYKGKTVTINAWDKASGEYLEVPIWQIYKKNKVGSLMHGDKVTLLDVNIYSSDGKSAKIETADGSTGHITYWYISEFEEATAIDPVLNMEY